MGLTEPHMVAHPVHVLPLCRAHMCSFVCSFGIFHNELSNFIHGFNDTYLNKSKKKEWSVFCLSLALFLCFRFWSILEDLDTRPADIPFNVLESNDHPHSLVAVLWELLDGEEFIVNTDLPIRRFKGGILITLH